MTQESRNVYEIYSGKRLQRTIHVEGVTMLGDIETEGTLLITGDKGVIQWAKDNNVAVLGYQPPEMREFLPVEYVIQSLEDVDQVYLERVFWRFHRIPWLILETQRCLVREFTMEDLDELFELYAKPGMTDFVEPLFSYEEEKVYEQAYIKNRYGYYGYGMWLVFDKETGALIGRAGLEDRDYGGDFFSDMQLELGYMIAPEFQRKGYAREVCKAILDYARKELEYDSVNCLVNPENEASICFMESMGFSYVGDSQVTGERLRRYVYKL